MTFNDEAVFQPGIEASGFGLPEGAPSDEISVGLTLIGFGGPDLTWEQLRTVSRQAGAACPARSWRPSQTGG